MRLTLINPSNALVNITNVKMNYWNQYRVWKPLGLLVLAGATPADWEVTVVDENLGVPDYDALPRPDLVGLTAFTSQASRAYDLAATFRRAGVPVVMGGIHATMRQEEAAEHVDAVVLGEGEGVWPQVLADARRRALAPLYEGVHVDMASIPAARHDLLPTGYRFGSIQVTRGCPLDCSFCSVTAFNGKRYRHRPVAAVIEELKTIREKLVLFVDDNLVGTGKQHVERAKELFRAMIDAKLNKRWMGQATINMADDEELLDLAARAGCYGVLVGFESPTEAGLAEVGKKFNALKNRDFEAAVKRMHKHGILVAGSFVLGLDADQKGIGRQIAEAAQAWGVDVLNVMLLTPLPGTRLWDKMAAEGRIVANSFPGDWKYYTMTMPVMSHQTLSWADMLDEMNACSGAFYTYPRIGGRALRALWRTRKPFSVFAGLATNLSFKLNERLDVDTHLGLDLSRGA